MGVTLNGLERRGLIGRNSDPYDGRRVVFSFTEAGRQLLKENRNARADAVAAALKEQFTDAEMEQIIAAAPLLKRLADGLSL